MHCPHLSFPRFSLCRLYSRYMFHICTPSVCLSSSLRPNNNLILFVSVVVRRIASFISIIKLCGGVSGARSVAIRLTIA